MGGGTRGGRPLIAVARAITGERVDDFPTRRRGPSWDFSEVADGEVYLLRRGRDFDVQVESLRHAARKWAAERGMRVETRSEFVEHEDARERVGLYVRFVQQGRRRR